MRTTADRATQPTNDPAANPVIDIFIENPYCRKGAVVRMSECSIRKDNFRTTIQSEFSSCRFGVRKTKYHRHLLAEFSSIVVQPQPEVAL